MTRSRFALLSLLALVQFGCHDPNKYLPNSPDSPSGSLNSPIHELAADQSTIKATGAAHSTITARIGPRSNVKTLRFSTTRGTLSGNGLTTSAERSSIDVPADDSGVATVDLQSSAQPGLATVTASITTTETPPRTFTRTVDVIFSAVASADAITLTATPTTADADGASRVLLTATLMPELATAYNEVIFTASAGEFTSNRNAASPTPEAHVPVTGNVVTAELKSSLSPGTVNVTARVGSFSAVTQVTLKPAPPDTVFIQPAKSTVQRVGGTVVITTYLLRNTGQTANNTVVTYEARDSSGTLIGTFLAPSLATIDAEDTSEPFKRLKSTVTFDPDDAAALGTATITARAGGKSANTTIQIVN